MVELLEDQLGVIEHLGGNKMRIKDFAAFAEGMGWDTSSEEYKAAFKAYNDSLIEYEQHIATDIRGEVDSLSQAKAGDKVNITRLTSELNNSEIIKIVEQYGATLRNGILDLTGAFNISELAYKLGQLAKENNLIAGTEIDSLLD